MYIIFRNTFLFTSVRNLSNKTNFKFDNNLINIIKATITDFEDSYFI